MHGGGSQLFGMNLLGFMLEIREDGANLALLLIARTFGGMCSLFFISLTTPIDGDLLSAEVLGAPGFLGRSLHADVQVHFRFY